MAKEKAIRVRLTAYDHEILDQSVEKILAVAKKTNAGVKGSLYRRKSRSTRFSALPSNTRIAVNNSRSAPTRDWFTSPIRKKTRSMR